MIDPDDDRTIRGVKTAEILYKEYAKWEADSRRYEFPGSKELILFVIF